MYDSVLWTKLLKFSLKQHLLHHSKDSLFPQTIGDWNALLDSLISSPEDAENCVAEKRVLKADVHTVYVWSYNLSKSYLKSNYMYNVFYMLLKLIQNTSVTYKIQWLDTPPFGHFMRIAHVTEMPSTGAPLFKQAEEMQITIKKYQLASTLSEVEFNWIFYSSIK